MSDQLTEMRVFARVAETGSFSGVARELAISQSTVSRLVAELEARLGAKLLLRTTHQVVTTDAGEVFLQHARGILDSIENAEEAARGADSLHGVLRVTAPSAFGTQTIIPTLASFLSSHPGLRIELLPADEMNDLVAQRADVAIRFGKLIDSEFGARRLAIMARMVVASPDYLERAGTPGTPIELGGHECLFGPGLSSRQSWIFEGSASPPSGLAERVRVATADGVVACAVAGLGIAVATENLCRRDLAASRLLPILQGFPLQSVELHAVYPAGRRPSFKVRIFTDHLAAAINARQPIPPVVG